MTPLTFQKKMDYQFVDERIRIPVQILNKHGFETFESCQGGEGHCFSEPTIRFFGSEFDCIRAFELLQAHGLCVYETKRVFRKVDIDTTNKKTLLRNKVYWDKPFNEIVFSINSQTGTIFLPSLV